MKKKLLILLSCFLYSVLLLQSDLSIAKPNRTSDSLNSLESSLGTLVDQSFTELQVPGAIIGVWMNGYEPWKKTLGVSNLSTNAPIQFDDKMRIGSVTKTFTGTVLLQLVDEGKISLIDKLSKYFPDFPNGDNITIDEVGNMSSGIYNYSEDTAWANKMFEYMNTSFTPMELIDVALKHPPYFAPGSSVHYSNTNFILLGLIIEKITGNPLQTEIQNRILTPLGMVHSNLAVNSDFPDPHARGYLYEDSTSMAPLDVTDMNPSWGWAAGSMISTLGDLSLYAKPLATGKLVSAKSQADRLMWSKAFDLPAGSWANKPLNYGFAIADFDGAIGHNGGIPGFNTFMGYLPDKDATIIVLVNMQDNKKGFGPADYIAMKILEKIKQM